MPSSSASNREQQVRQDTTENERKSEQQLQNHIRHGLLQGIDLMLKLKNVGSHTLVTLRAPLHHRSLFGYHDSANAAFRATILGDTGSERHKGAIAGVVSEATGTTGEHFR